MRAGKPSQEKVFPAALEATLSQQQAEDIVKAAASRIATRKVRQECTSEIPGDYQMRVEKIGVAREVPPSNSSAQQADTIGLQVDRLRTVREVTKTHGRESDSTLEDVSKLGNSSIEVLNVADTAADRFAVSLASPIVVPRSQLGGINPEGKHVHQVAVMTCTPLTDDFTLLVRSRERMVEDINWEKGQLAEVMVVENHHQRLMEERWKPATVAVKGVDHEMIDELLKELEELDKPHELSEDDEAVIEDLLYELELEIAFPAREERIELTAKIEGNELRANPDVSAKSISEDNGASRSDATMEAEGRCGSKRSHLTGRFERPNSLIPVEVIQQRPTLCHRRRLWVSHRKHGRWKHERQQMGLRGLCWPTHRNHGRWKPDEMVPPLPMQPRPERTRRWSSRRKRSRWKSVNRCSV